MFEQRSAPPIVALALLAAALLPATALAERPYDRDVAKTIDRANEDLGRFTNRMDDKAKRSQITRAGVTTDVSDFLKDLKAEGQRLNDRFGPNDAAGPTAMEFLRRAKTVDRFVTEHPGFSGADSEWASLVPTLKTLGAAYQIDWSANAETWSPVRSTDNQVKEMIGLLDRRISDAGKALASAAKAAKVEKKTVTAMNNSVKGLRASAKSLKSSFDKKQVVSGQYAQLRTGVQALGDQATELGIAGAAKASWGPLQSTMDRLAIALGAV